MLIALNVSTILILVVIFIMKFTPVEIVSILHMNRCDENIAIEIVEILVKHKVFFFSYGFTTKKSIWKQTFISHFFYSSRFCRTDSYENYHFKWWIFIKFTKNSQLITINSSEKSMLAEISQIQFKKTEPNANISTIKMAMYSVSPWVVNMSLLWNKGEKNVIYRSEFNE